MRPQSQQSTDVRGNRIVPVAGRELRRLVYEAGRCARLKDAYVKGVRNAQHVHQLRQWQAIHEIHRLRTAVRVVAVAQPHELNGGRRGVREQCQIRIEQICGAGQKGGRCVGDWTGIRLQTAERAVEGLRW